MKIAFISKLPPMYLDDFHARNQGSLNGTHQELLEALINDHFQFYCSMIKFLRSKDHEATIISPHYTLLNDKWRSEHHSNAKDGEEITLARIAKEKPDLIFLNSNFEYYHQLKQNIHNLGIPICAWISCPIQDDLNLDHINTIFTLFPPHKEYFTQKGIHTVFVTAGFDENLIKLSEKEKAIQSDVSFVGGIGGYHREREKILAYLCRRVKINLFGYGFKSRHPIKNILKQFYYRFAFTRSFKGQAWGLNMFNILRNSKITVNIHGDIQIGYSVNLRLFEATGMGTLLLTEDTEGLRKLFIPGEEVVAFTSKEDALQKIRYYLENEEERKAIAKRGQERTLRDYNYADKFPMYLNEFKRIIEEHQQISLEKQSNHSDL